MGLFMKKMQMETQVLICQRCIPRYITVHLLYTPLSMLPFGAGVSGQTAAQEADSSIFSTRSESLVTFPVTSYAALHLRVFWKPGVNATYIV